MSTVAGLLKTLFRNRRPRSSRSRTLRAEQQQLETLENRLAMAVDVAFQTPSGGSGEDWVTILADSGSDAYVKKVATASEDLFIADNASFFDRQVIEGVESAIDNLYVFHGQNVNRTTTFTNDDTRFGVPIGYPAGTVNEMQFRFPDEAINFGQNQATSPQGTPITGTVQKGNLEPDITFTVNNGGQVTSNVPDLQVTFSSLDRNSGFLVTLRSAQLGIDVGSNGTPTLGMSYNTNVTGNTNAPVFRTTGLSRAISSVGGNGSGGVTRFQLFDPAHHQVVPGTLSGTIDINFPEVRETLANNPLVFQVQEIGQDNVIVPLSFGNDNFPISEGSEGGGARNLEAYFVFDHRENNGGDNGEATLVVEGDLNTLTGVVTLRTSFDYNGRTNPVALATTLDNVTMGLRDLDPNDDLTDPQGTQFDVAANSFTLFDDQTFTRGLSVELHNAGSGIFIESPLVTAGGEADNVTLSASQVRINTPLRASSQFTVPSQEDTFFGTITESLEVNAPVASPIFDIRIADANGSGNIERSQLHIGSAGSLSNLSDAAVLNPSTGVLTEANRAYIEVHDGDIFVEGQIAAQFQSYALTSGIGSEDEGPYVFTTRSQSTGVDTGLISGNTVGVTLGNDTFGPGFESFQTVFSDVSLSTAVDRLRIQAASRESHSANFPFPYNLSINETGDLIVDAVSASSGSIDVAATGSLDFLAAIQSLGDINFSSGDAFTVSAPISTSFGKISISGPEVTVNNSVRVLDGLANFQQTDITLTATNGPLVLNDAVLAINGVQLTANGANGVISGDARIISDKVDVEAGANVGLLTKANRVRVRTPGDVRLEEQESAAFEVSGSSFVTIVANGQDKLLDYDNDPTTGDGQGREALSPALYADIVDAEKVVVSAPNGSVDVLHDGSRPVEIGDGDAIRASEANPAVFLPPELVTAAGSVVIRSNFSGNVLVSDAPAATSGAIVVRFATTQALPDTSIFEQIGQTPDGEQIAGVHPVDLTVELDLDVGQAVTQLGGVNANDINLGDRLLVKDGLTGYTVPETGLVDANVVNGIYVVREKEFITDLGDVDASKVKLVMRRATAFDETSDLDGRRYIRVRDGSNDPALTTRGKIFVSDGFDASAPGSAFPTPLVVDSVPSQSGYVTASAVTTGSLNATYDADSGQITAIENGSIENDASLFDDVVLAENDKVLVREPVGAGTDKTALGLYTVTDEGGAGPWVLTRYDGFDEDGVGGSDAFFTGIVAINRGLLRTSDTGEMFKIGYDAINFAPLVFNEITDFRDFDDGNGGTYLTEQFDPTVHYRTDIGTANPLGIVTFAVTSQAGVNNATGSLGRTLQLVQDNAARVGRPGGVLEGQRFQTVISDTVSRIDLEQELPLINLPVTLVATNGLTIDGSRIEFSRDGGVVRTGGIFSRMGPIKPSVVSTARRLIRDAGDEADLSEVTGLKIGSGGAGTIIRNVAIGGFGNGAAIDIVGAENVLIDQVLVGIDADGNAMPNEYGIRVSSAINGNSEFSTIQNSTIAASTVAGISLQDNVDGVRIVNNQIGLNGLTNTIGVEVDSNQNGVAHIGVGRILPSAGVPTQSITPLDANSISVVKTTITEDFEVGLQFLDRSGDREWAVTAITEDPSDATKYMLDLSGPAFEDIELDVSFIVEAGYFADVVARGEEITLSSGVDRDRLHVGQLITGTVSGAINPGTYISSIEAGSNGETVIGLSQPALKTLKTGIVFNAPGRNSISFNADGIILKSGSSKIRTTDVARSIYDGIRIEGVAANGQHEIGGAKGSELNEDNVSVNSNALAGIRFTEAFFAGLGTLAEKELQADKVNVRGNYLGTNLVFAEGLSNGLDGATNILFEDADLQAAYITDSSRGADGRYNAKYRPEDNPEQDASLVEFETLDSESNKHFTGDPVTLLPPNGGGGLGGGFPGFGGGDDDSDDGPDLPTPPTMR